MNFRFSCQQNHHTGVASQNLIRLDDCFNLLLIFFVICWNFMNKAHSRNFKVGSELNWTQRMHLGSPYKKGEEEYSKCEMYKVLLLVNYNHNEMSLIDCE